MNEKLKFQDREDLEAWIDIVVHKKEYQGQTYAVQFDDGTEAVVVIPILE